MADDGVWTLGSWLWPEDFGPPPSVGDEVGVRFMGIDTTARVYEVRFRRGGGVDVSIEVTEPVLLRRPA